MDKNIVSIVTGGGRGIGRAIALRLARETPVMLVGRTASHLRAVCAEIRAAGGIADHLTGDVGRPSTARACVERVHKSGRCVRHLVCNAGIGKGGNTDSFDPALFAEMMRVNVNGAFNFVPPCLPDMLAAQDGTICFIGSVLSVRGHKREAGYAAGKHALAGLSRSLHDEYARKGLRVTAVCPGFVDSEMTQRVIDGLVRHRNISETDARAIVARSNKSNRILSNTEVADMVAAVCTGKHPVDGEPLIME